MRESVCLCGGGGGARGVINEDWNVERKQSRPHRHLSFTKLARLTDFLFFFLSSPLNRYHPSGLCHPLTHMQALVRAHIKRQPLAHTHSPTTALHPIASFVIFFFSLPLNVEQRALEFTLSSIFIHPHLSVLCIRLSARWLLRNGKPLNLG